MWKFAVPVTNVGAFGEVQMPARSEIVRVGQQDDEPMVWAIVNPNETEMEMRRLMALPTGVATDRRVAYLGTTEVYGGAVVVHVFEVMDV